MATSMLDQMVVQVGKQAAFGTAVPATAKLALVTDFSLSPQTKVKVFSERRGSFAPGYLAVVTSDGAEGKIEGVQTYDDLYLIEGLLGEAVPQGADPYTRDYAAPIGSAIAPRLQTFEYGDANGAYRLVGGIVKKWSLKGKSGEDDTELTYSADLIGQSVEPHALTAALEDREVKPVMGSELKVFVDAWDGVIGATAVESSTFAFELEFDLGAMFKRSLGSLKPMGYAHARPEPGDCTLKLTMEFSAVTKAYLDAILGGLTQKLVRIQAESGLDYLFQIDFAGTFIEMPELFKDEDGITTVELALQATYNPTLENWLKISTSNKVASLP